MTVVCCMSASRYYNPPCLFYPKKLIKELIDEALAGTLCNAQEFRQIITTVF